MRSEVDDQNCLLIGVPSKQDIQLPEHYFCRLESGWDHGIAVHRRLQCPKNGGENHHHSFLTQLFCESLNFKCNISSL